MSKEPPGESLRGTKRRESLKITAKKTEKMAERLCQGDILQDIEIIENVYVEKSQVVLQKISFPFVVCLNQECDLETDYLDQRKLDNHLLHIAIAPAFNFEQFLSGNHWGDIFDPNNPQKRGTTLINKIIDNEIPRYHYLNFAGGGMPELIVDFKHFFSIYKEAMYAQLEKRMCCLDDLFREKINQRFSYYISRIGLPDTEES